jgi:hypothetical protein
MHTNNENSIGSERSQKQQKIRRRLPRTVYLFSRWHAYGPGSVGVTAQFDEMVTVPERLVERFSRDLHLDFAFGAGFASFPRQRKR